MQHESDIAILLNRTGRTATDLFGYSDAGMDVIFDDSGTHGDSHDNFAGTLILSGSFWEPDGRASDPATALDTDARTNLLDRFTGMNPEGCISGNNLIQ